MKSQRINEIITIHPEGRYEFVYHFHYNSSKSLVLASAIFLLLYLFDRMGCENMINHL